MSRYNKFKPIKETVTTGAFADFTTGSMPLGMERRNKKPKVQQMDKNGKTKEENKKKTLKERIDSRISETVETAKGVSEKTVYLFEDDKVLVFAKSLNGAQKLANKTERPSRMYMRVPEDIPTMDLVEQLGSGKLDTFKIDDERLAAAPPEEDPGRRMEIEQVLGEEGTKQGGVLSEWTTPEEAPLPPTPADLPDETPMTGGVIGTKEIEDLGVTDDAMWYLYLGDEQVASAPFRDELVELIKRQGLSEADIELTNTPKSMEPVEVQSKVGPLGGELQVQDFEEIKRIPETDVTDEELEQYEVDPFTQKAIEDEELQDEVRADVVRTGAYHDLEEEKYNDNYEEPMSYRQVTNKATDGKVVKKELEGDPPVVGETYTEEDMTYVVMSGIFESKGKPCYLIEIIDEPSDIS